MLNEENRQKQTDAQLFGLAHKCVSFERKALDLLLNKLAKSNCC